MGFWVTPLFDFSLCLQVCYSKLIRNIRSCALNGGLNTKSMTIKNLTAYILPLFVAVSLYNLLLLPC